MISSLPFEWFILLLRVVFIFLIYFFLAQVIRVILREMRSYSVARSEAGSEPRGSLIVNSPGGAGLPRGARFELEPVSLIGRHPRATIRIDDGFVSGEHAQITWHDDGWWITDLGSTNGTLLNGEPVSVPVPMRFGDLIQLGDVQLQLAP